MSPTIDDNAGIILEIHPLCSENHILYAKLPMDVVKKIKDAALNILLL